MSPGEFLLEELMCQRMDEAELAERMGLPLETVREVIAGDELISPHLAAALSGVLGVSQEVWSALEASYRSCLRREKEAEL